MDILSFRSGYMEEAYNLPALIDTAGVLLEGVEFDTLVGTGLSGALVLPALAAAMGKHFLVIRKDTEATHAHWKAEGQLGKRWLFVDDVIDSGATLRRVHYAVYDALQDRRSDHETDFVGAYLYHYAGEYLCSGFHPAEQLTDRHRLRRPEPRTDPPLTIKDMRWPAGHLFDNPPRGSLAEWLAA